MKNTIKILYVDLGGVTVYSMDKTAGRILGWAEENNDVFLLVPELIKETAEKEIRNLSRLPEKIRIINLPFSARERKSGAGIIFSYFLRLVFSPIIFFKKIPKFDIGYSNSPVLVDIAPILWLKLFGRCRHWVLMLDSVVPRPSHRSGSAFINTITYLEARVVAGLANRFATAVFTVNPELKREIITNGIQENKVFLTRNGLFTNRINRVLDCDRKQYDAVYMGRITENKGIIDLIAVWSGVVKVNSSAKLVILGTGREEVVSSLLSTIKEKKLDKNIEYLGYVRGDKKYEILKSCKIFIFLSKINSDESWGITLMEALACGLPAITYNLAIYEHVYDRGLLFKNDIGDISAVIEKTIFLLNNPKEWENIAAAGIKFCQKFDWFSVAKEDLEIIKKI